MHICAFSSLRRSFLSSRHHSTGHETRFQPFANQAQDDRVSNPMGYHFLEPIVLNVVKVSPNVGLEQVPYLLRDDHPA